MAMVSKVPRIAPLESSATYTELRMIQSARIALAELGVTLQESLMLRANAARVTSASLDRQQQHHLQ